MVYSYAVDVDFYEPPNRPRGIHKKRNGGIAGHRPSSRSAVSTTYEMPPMFYPWRSPRIYEYSEPSGATLHPPILAVSH